MSFQKYHNSRDNRRRPSFKLTGRIHPFRRGRTTGDGVKYSIPTFPIATVRSGYVFYTEKVSNRRVVRIFGTALD